MRSITKSPLVSGSALLLGFILALSVGVSTQNAAHAQSSSMTPGQRIDQAINKVDKTLKDVSQKVLGEFDASPEADSDMQQVLDAHQKLGAKPLETLTPAQARLQPSMADAVKEVLKEQGKSTEPEAGVTTHDISIPGPAGTIPARVYTPEAAANLPLPVIVYYHGGGFVIADLDTYDASARALAKKAHAIVLSSHYRQAPEHPFPAAHQDAFAAYQWALENAASFDGDPSRIAVAGESAGANLALNVSMMARDKGVQLPVHQVLIYPVADTGMDTPSYIQNANAKPLNKAMMKWFVDQSLKSADAKQSAQGPTIDLVDADLSNLPPATIITAEIDPLRSEGQRLAVELEKAGDRVNEQNYEGVTHEFFGAAAVVEDARNAQDYVARQLRTAFNEETDTEMTGDEQ